MGTWASRVVLVVKYSPANAGDIWDAGSIPGSGRLPGGGNGNPLQRSYLEDSIDRGAWRAIVHRVTKSWTQVNNRTHAHTRVVRDAPVWQWWGLYPILSTLPSTVYTQVGGDNSQGKPPRHRAPDNVLKKETNVNCVFFFCIHVCSYDLHWCEEQQQQQNLIEVRSHKVKWWFIIWTKKPTLVWMWLINELH